MQSTEGSTNLTPMLDMVFQLITFFMLVINFKSAALDLSLSLPVVGSAAPVETSGQEFLVLNVNRDGELKVTGIVQPVESYIAREASASRLTAKRLNRDFKDDDDLPTTIVIRADEATSFHYLNRVIKACQDNGFRRFALKTKMEAKPKL